MPKDGTRLTKSTSLNPWQMLTSLLSAICDALVTVGIMSEDKNNGVMPGENSSLYSAEQHTHKLTSRAHRHKQTRTQTHAHVHAHTHTHTDMHAYTQTRIHKHTITHMQVHTQTHTRTRNITGGTHLCCTLQPSSLQRSQTDLQLCHRTRITHKPTTFRDFPPYSE